MNEPEEQKQIFIDPNHFKISSNKTRKRDPNAPPKIKVKSSVSKDKKTKPSTLKKNLIRFIRDHQEQQRKKEMKKPVPLKTTQTTDPSDTAIKSDFDKSLDFFHELEKSNKEATATASATASATTTHNNRNNHTLRNYDKQLADKTNTPVILEEFDINTQSMYPPVHLRNAPPPQYGCLKNGNLPTYRVWKNQTQRQYPCIPNQAPQPNNGPINATQPTPLRTNHYSTAPYNPRPKPTMDIPASSNQLNYQSRLQDTIQNMSETEQYRKWRDASMMRKLNAIPTWNKGKNQKRIIRRTFRTGKSKVHPRVSVLVANKTIRNNTNLKKIELLETPIQDVKRYLKKQGLIKVGSNTPNEILRQMYECVKMMCGEVKNHNPENLLYNYFHHDMDTE